MTLWRCRRCSTRFAVGLDCCPQCTGMDVEEDGDMAKISVHGGATNAAADVQLRGEHGPEHEFEQLGTVLPPTGDETDLDPPNAEGSEQSSPGNSSETSPEKPPTNDEPKKADPPKRARTTGSRSSKGRKGASTARSTATGGQGTDA